jgi:dynein heavy chain
VTFKTLLDDAESCKTKMVAASALINGLGGEKVRWTQQSKEFEEQIGR